MGIHSPPASVLLRGLGEDDVLVMLVHAAEPLARLRLPRDCHGRSVRLAELRGQGRNALSHSFWLHPRKCRDERSAATSGRVLQYIDDLRNVPPKLGRKPAWPALQERRRHLRGSTEEIDGFRTLQPSWRTCHIRVPTPARPSRLQRRHSETQAQGINAPLDAGRETPEDVRSITDGAALMADVLHRQNTLVPDDAQRFV